MHTERLFRFEFDAIICPFDFDQKNATEKGTDNSY